MAEITVVVGDRYPVMRDSLTAHLTAEGIRVVGSDSCPENIMKLAVRERPAAIVVNHNLFYPSFPGEAAAPPGRDTASSLDGIKRIRDCAGAPLVLLLNTAEIAKTVQALQCGVSAVVLTTAARLADLAEAVRWAARGEMWISPPLLPPLLSIYRPRGEARGTARLSRLTRRELEVLGLLVHGMDRTAIAAQLHLSRNTVRTHMQNLLRKLGVHSAVAAVSVAASAEMCANEMLYVYGNRPRRGKHLTPLTAGTPTAWPLTATGTS
jgi:DNA-binding NarL/FixJ family response regulator